jgi:hypothetical protein
MPKGKNLVRLLWLALLIIFLATTLPGVLGHPFPRPIAPYIVYGGLAIYIVGALLVVAFAGKLRGTDSK